MQRIRMLLPFTANENINPEIYSDIMAELYPELDISCAFVEEGPASIETEADELAAVPGLLALAKVAKQDGVDGIIVDCMGDPGVSELQQFLSIPVLGPARTCFHLAAMQSNKSTVIASSPDIVPMFWQQISEAGLKESLFSVRSIDVPVLAIHDSNDAVIEALVAESILAATEDGASHIVLGCTGFTSLGDDVQQRLQQKGYSIRVINPIPKTISMMQTLLQC